MAYCESVPTSYKSLFRFVAHHGLRRQTDHIEGSHQVHLDYLAEMVEWCGTVFTEDLNKKVNSRNEVNPRVKRVERPLLLPYTSSR